MVDAKTNKASGGIPDYLKCRCFVKWGKDLITILMDPDEPVRVLNEQLEEHTGVPVEAQKLFYRGIKRPFAADKTLRYYGARSGGFFDLKRDDHGPPQRKPRRRSSFPPASMAAIPKRVSKRVSIKKLEELSKRISKRVSQRISIKELEEDDNASISSSESETEDSVEEKSVQEDETQKERRRSSLLVHTPTITLDETSFHEDQIPTFTLEANKKELLVEVKTWDGQTISVSLDPNDTLEVLRSNLSGECHLKPAVQVLQLRSQEDLLLLDHTQDTESITDLNILDGAQLMVEPAGVQVIVKTPAKHIRAQAAPAISTVEDFCHQLQAESGIAAEHQRLLLQDGTPLQDVHLKLEEYGVQKGSILEMVDKRQAV